ncbi:MAG: ATP-binding cassette, subfamily bacterial CvaB/MchF/RaxB [Sphingomonadales bacterium]|jgi:ATP-binding cassette subfamily B protein RaxB|nr:ATP-binding cassette, subfamily bacterial CvaB/MchF/RaxB [Sphingomonadales bacterium]
MSLVDAARGGAASLGALLSYRRAIALQSEPAECGLACLATVAWRFGYEVDMLSLRSRFSISLKGASLATLMRIAEAMGMTARALRLEPEDLPDLALPAILHWNMSHFVVLERVRGGAGRRRYHISDPAGGARIVNEAELRRSFTGVAAELAPGPDFQPRRARPRLRMSQLWSRIHHLGAAIAQIVAVTMVMQLVVLSLPFFAQIAIDTVLPMGDRRLLLTMTIGFLLIAATGIGASALRGYLTTNLGQVLSYQLVVNLTRHLFKLPLAWFEKRQVGDLLSRLDSTAPISDFLSRNLLSSLVDGVMAITLVIVMALYSWQLTLLALVMIGLYALVRFAPISLYNRRNYEAVTARGREHGLMIENLNGIAGIKAFGQENERLSIWLARKASAVNRGTAVARIQTVWDMLEPSVRAIDSILFVAVGVLMVMNGSITLGMVFALAAYKQQLLTAAINLIQLAGSYRSLDVHLDRIAEVAFADAEPSSSGDFALRDPVRGDLELRNVSYGYGVGESPVLTEVSLSVSAGETVAIEGRSGAGKTTLLKVMLGLLNPSEGTLFIDGIPLDRYGSRAWRRQVGYVAQDDVLYSGTLAQNISFFDPEIDAGRVIEAAKQASIHDEIVAMPMGYESLVGDMGSALSGGQRARVLIARALYRNPRVLVIDEGTAHLDVEMENRVNASLRRLGITRVIVSHRPETIAFADRVYRLHEGRIAEVASRRREATRRRPSP